MANNGNLIPFTSDQSREEAKKNGQKGGKASGPARRKKNAARKYLAEIMACMPRLTPAMKANLAQMGTDPDNEVFTVERLSMLALAQKAMKGDTRAIELYLSMFGEDPKTTIEKERLRIQEEAVKAIKNNDGFMEAMSAAAGEVFVNGGDTPEDVDD